MAFEWRKTPGYLADFGFVVGFFLISIFLVFGAYNPLGEGIVVFKNNKATTTTDVYDTYNFNNYQRGIYVGFDKICMPDTGAATILATNLATSCYDYKAAEHGRVERRHLGDRRRRGRHGR